MDEVFTLHDCVMLQMRETVRSRALLTGAACMITCRPFAGAARLRHVRCACSRSTSSVRALSGGCGVAPVFIGTIQVLRDAPDKDNLQIEIGGGRRHEEDEDKMRRDPER